MHIPKSFLAKLLQRLVRSHLLTSSRGVNGGFQIAQKPSEITLLSIMEAVQGPVGIICAIDSRRRRVSTTCTVHPVWVENPKRGGKATEKGNDCQAYRQLAVLEKRG
jgi:Rrf2 family protein